MSIGKDAERHAERWLSQQGLTTITRNYRSRMGEIDLIMRDGNTIVFVEVRYRKHSRYGSAAATVTWHKQRKLLRTASLYLQQRRWSNRPARFDVIGLSPAPENPPASNCTHTDIHKNKSSTATFSYNWCRNAFTA